jgi:hypothetical protein
MNPYQIHFAGPAKSQFDLLRQRAIQAGRIREFEWWFTEIGQMLVDPAQALRVGQLLYQTQPPLIGGYYRDWRYGCFYLRYAIFPDAGQGFIFHIEFSPPNWA